MSLVALPVLYALFVWWFSTGAILYLDGLPQRSFRWSMLGATLLFGVSVCGLVISRSDVSPTGAYVAFTSGLVIWAWVEMTYYMGFVTGPRRVTCVAGCAGWAHFGHALASSLYHELLTLGLAGLILGTTWRMPNQIGLWTFIVLWWMQISAKLNVFLGVPNLNEDFLPEHLSFLKSFLTKKPMNLLFPVSVTVSIVIETLLAQKAVSAGATPFETTGFAILGALLGLAILEHWFLVVPLPAAALWAWSLTSRALPQAAPIVAEPDDPDTAEAPGGCARCRPRPEAAAEDLVLQAQRGGDKAFPRNLVAGVFVEAALPHPVTPSIARRQI